MTKTELAHIIDHTLLDPKATPTDIARIANEALEHQFGAICVNSGYVQHAKSCLPSSQAPRIAATVGFPLGQANAAGKIAEAEQACRDGATEIDAVWNLGLFLGKQYDKVSEEIRLIKQALGSQIFLKIILETGWLTPEQIRQGTVLAVDAGADMVKTSTGFGAPGASIDAVRIMRESAPEAIGVKASGGIRTLADAMAMVDAGATRLGLSRSVSILAEWPISQS
ncbi:MAG: deoxyribose-phosphate aldolase [Sulfobacillus benefaciens]|uniref:Deoxyribose-phosphate aldolase n=1 Tax=Sulfobacillus benefaciens TaxID=453960 RepID=A0A2T2X8V6_9FIRM|nr:MAG: deoxyribose-phosphate aldolase [Sulfobacillus benefaciens]